MSAVLSKYLGVFNAKQFKESVSEPSSSNLYMTIGRSLSWPSDSNPTVPNTSSNSYFDIWNNMVGAKRITGNDIRHCVPRFNWQSGSVYYAYDNLVDSKILNSSNTAFYVLTEDWNVYKCLANNYGVTSTVKPSSISTVSDFQTSDGYIWKYMYTITEEERIRFVTNNYIPVKTLQVNDGSLQWGVQNNAISGAIHSILVTNSGTNYTANDIYITITGDGSDANAYAVRNVTTNTISSIIVDNKGFDYSYADIAIGSPTGISATARAIASPVGGHGSDPLTELGGSNLVLHIQFKGDESGKIPVVNEYRQFAILEDPLVYDSTVIISNTNISQTTILTLNGTSPEYDEDEIVYQGSSLSQSTFRGNVVEWDSANNKLKINNTKGTPTSELIIGNSSGAGRFLGTITNPDMNPYTGKLLYVNNSVPIHRSIDQTEDFKIILNF